ncbi:MAG: hypothetical protein ACFB2Z_00390 [Maricaulaceae bacterium]
MILPLVVGVVVRAAATYAAKRALKGAAQKALRRHIQKKIKKAYHDAKKKLRDDKKCREQCKHCKKQHELKNPCQSLRKSGGKNSKHPGGAYSGVKAPGAQANHMPAKAAYPEGSPIRNSRAPAIRMDPEDHKDALSTGNSRGARLHQARQARLIAKGKIEEAFKLDAEDLIAQFGHKYAEGIGEAAAYIDCLKKYGMVE